MAKMESESELSESELDDVAGGFWGTYAAVRAGAKLVYWLLKNPHFRQSLIM